LRYRPDGPDTRPRQQTPPPDGDSSVGGGGQRFAGAPGGPPAPRPPVESRVQTPKHSPPRLDDPNSKLGSFEPAKLLAIVGNQPILVGDLLPQINQFLKANADKLAPGQFEDNKDRWLRMVLEQSIDTKLAFVDFLRSIPPERLELVQGKINEQFDETELPKAMQKAEVKTPAELDAKLREFGSSLEKQRRLFAEQILAFEMIRQNVKRDKEVTHQEMLDYYHEHEKEFRVDARARWEHLGTRFSEFPDKDAAWRATVDMGNEVLGGAPLAAVARRRSQAFDAEEGGLNDWTTKDSLRSEPLNQAIFSLPLNRMSEIIEDEEGFHIVRVIEREPAGLVPFVEAQVKIKEKIQKQRFEEQKTAYLDRLRKQTTIWTAFDDVPTDVSARPDPGGSRPSPY
jgi:parvulin-like peptidyl-prolyl isomerase